MRVVVIGLGSMGKRRIRLLKQIDSQIEMIGIDLNKERQQEVSNLYGIRTVDTLEEICNKEVCDAAFVCTSPISHAKVIDACLDMGLHVFTEINVIADGYGELIQKAEQKNLNLFLSSTMLYRKELQYITKRVKEQDQQVSYHYHVGQYLPDWHPWESYKDFFVNNKRTNGCRELFAIELPWLIKAFGKIESIHVEKSKMTSLEIDYNDHYLVTLVHETGHKGSLIVDVVSRKAIRRIEVMSEDLYLTWEGTPQSLMEYDFNEKVEHVIETYTQIDKDKNYSTNIIENAYADEIIHFINVIQDKEPLIYSFKEDQETLNWIDQIER